MSVSQIEKKGGAYYWGSGEPLNELELAALDAIQAMSCAIVPNFDTPAEMRDALLAAIVRLSNALRM